MSTRVGAIGIIVGTLLIGVVIGALVVGPLEARRHFKRIADLRTPKGFAERMEEIIRPDADQVRVLRPILVKYGQAFDEVSSRHRDEVKALIDSLNAELDTVLTADQKERLEQSRRRLGPPGGPGDHHGGPGEHPEGPGDHRGGPGVPDPH
jgi:hypothetical protein